MVFHVITLFPECFSYFDESIVGRAQERKKVKIKFHNPRDFARNRHRTADDKPYGGGAGMVLAAPPILRAVGLIQRKKKSKVIILSAKGKQFCQKAAADWSKLDQLILISGRYEGIDERVRVALRAEEVSLGPYVLTDGDVAAMAIVSAVSRLVPGVIRQESLEEESHWNLLLKQEQGKGTPAGRTGGLEYPHYTRPEVVEYRGRKYRVPKILLSGDHKKIKAWRESKSR